MEARDAEEASRLQEEQDAIDYKELEKTDFRVLDCPMCGSSHIELTCENILSSSESYMICAACGLRGTQGNAVWKAIRNWNKMVLEHDKKDAEAEKRRT